jgi:hypothetical protein
MMLAILSWFASRREPGWLSLLFMEGMGREHRIWAVRDSPGKGGHFEEGYDLKQG